MEGQLGRAVQQSSKPLFIMDGIKKIRCGYEHTLVIDEMGKLYVFGVGISIPNIVWNWGSLPNKRTSQLDIDSALKLICEDAVDVETGPYHCLIKRANGKLYACGCLHNGRLMQTPTLQLIEIPGFENVDQIALGHYFSLFSDPKAPVPSRPVQKEEKLKSKKEDKEDNDDDDDDYW